MIKTVVAASLAAFLLSSVSHASVNDDIECLAKNIYHEARGEPEIGQYAVAFVTINRTEDERFHGSICDVVYAPSQFSWTRHRDKPIKDSDSYKKAVYIAENVVYNNKIMLDPTDGSLYFERSKKTSKSKKITRIIGNHKFYK